MGVLRVRVNGEWVDVGTPMPPQYRRNMLDNAANQVGQRPNSTVIAGATSLPGPSDRWNIQISNVGNHTPLHQSITTFGVPTPAGFMQSAIYGVQTNAAGTASGSDYGLLDQCIEGQNLAHLLWGTANAKPVTLSGLIYTSVAGRFYLELTYQSAPSRFITWPLDLVVGWNYFAHTFPGNTADVMTNDSQGTLRVRVWFAAGTDYTSGTWTSAWQSTSANRVPGQSNAYILTVNNVFAITQFQFEVGDVATPFEVVDFQTEFTRASRYLYVPAYNFGENARFYRHYTTGAYNEFSIPCPTLMRIPSPALLGGVNTGFRCYVSNGGAGATISGVSAVGANPASITVGLNLTGSVAEVSLSFVNKDGRFSAEI